MVTVWDGIAGPVDNNATIKLNSPANNSNFSTAAVTFNMTATDDFKIQNVSLIIDGVYNFTNSSISVNETDIIIPLNLSDGDYNWTGISSDNVSQTGTTVVRFFTVDTTATVINVTFPNETVIFQRKNNNINVNWTVSDATIGLDTCWINYNGVNTTVTCGDNNSTINITTSTVKTLTFFANDTLNNRANETVSWDYRLFLNSETFVKETIEGIATIFSANFFTNGSSIDHASLRYNNTNFSGSIANPTTDNFTVSRAITAPGVNAETNITFFWNISQGNSNFQLAPQNQTVLDLSIDDCSTNSINIYNFTILDEGLNFNKLNGTASNTLGKIDFNLFSPAGVLITEYSNNFTQINPFNICLSESLNDSFIHDVEIQYGANNFQTELYNIQNETLNSTLLNRNISLLDLNDSDAQVFKIIFKFSG